jgi:hypothetical protein
MMEKQWINFHCTECDDHFYSTLNRYIRPHQVMAGKVVLDIPNLFCGMCRTPLTWDITGEPPQYRLDTLEKERS